MDKVSLSHHRDIVIPFERKEDAEKLVENWINWFQDQKQRKSEKLNWGAELKETKSQGLCRGAKSLKLVTLMRLILVFISWVLLVLQRLLFQ